MRSWAAADSRKTWRSTARAGCAEPPRRGGIVGLERADRARTPTALPSRAVRVGESAATAHGARAMLPTDAVHDGQRKPRPPAGSQSAQRATPLPHPWVKLRGRSPPTARVSGAPYLERRRDDPAAMIALLPRRHDDGSRAGGCGTEGGVGCREHAIGSRCPCASLRRSRPDGRSRREIGLEAPRRATEPSPRDDVQGSKMMRRRDACGAAVRPAGRGWHVPAEGQAAARTMPGRIQAERGHGMG